LLYTDGFMFLTDTRTVVLLLRDRVETLLHRLGLQRNPEKCLWELIQVGDHLGLPINLSKGEFRAPTAKLHALAK
jgi:hypothetical protein